MYKKRDTKKQLQQDSQPKTQRHRHRDKHKYYIEGFTYDFVPKENLQLYTGIADALQWDFETMEDPIGNPSHDHCHHLSAYAQERWATEIAIPKISNIL